MSTIKHLVFLLLVLTLQFRGYGKVYWVTNTNDSGAGSLRAVKDSCSSGDTIRFVPDLISAGSDTIILNSGELDFGNKSVTIIGLYNGNDTLFISGNNNSRIFSFNGAGRVVLDSLVLINGNGVGATKSGYGGAVFYYSGKDTLYIKNCVIKNNSGVFGGGVAAYVNTSSPTSLLSASISITNSIINGNYAAQNGGGVAAYIYSSIPLYITVVNSSISDNSVRGGSGGGIYAKVYYSPSKIRVINSTISGNDISNFGFGGGGIFSDAQSDTSFVNVIRSNISNNIVSASYEGGGMYSRGSASFVNIISSTISGNKGSDGGGIYSEGLSTTSYVTVKNSTIVGNTAFYGGGIYSKALNSVINITSSIAAFNTANGNTATSNFYSSSPSSITSGGYNIFNNNPNWATTTDQTNITSAQLNLQPLDYNGGNTKTMLPGPGSVAIDMGNPNDMSDAQNGPVCVRRDVGAAETGLSFSTIFPTACSNYTSPSGNYIWTQSGTYYDTIPNSIGCDSIITINLTIQNTTSTINDSACNSYTSPSGKYVWTQSGTYKDTIPNSVGCDSIITINLTIIPIDTSVSVNSLTLTANESAATYQWLNCDSNYAEIPGATNQSFTATSSGNYAVRITKNGCVDTSSCFYVQISGIVKNDFGDNLSVYPNPNSGYFTIDLGKYYNKIEVLITDISGKYVYKKVFINSQSPAISIKEVPSGVYFVNVIAEGKEAIIKLMKE